MNKNAYEKICIDNFSRLLWYVYVPKKRLSSNFSGIPAYPKNLKVLSSFDKSHLDKINLFQYLLPSHYDYKISIFDYLSGHCVSDSNVLCEAYFYYLHQFCYMMS